MAAAPLPVHLVKFAQEELQSARAKPIRSAPGFTFRGSEHQMSGAFEADEIAYVRERLAGCDVFVDVGANYGLYTCVARSTGVPAIAIEPFWANLRLLYRNLADNGWHDTLVYPVALGDAPGLLTLFGSGTGASLIAGWAGAVQQTTVAVHTLDSLLRGADVLGKRLLIKMDVEGAEHMVLSGAAATLAADPAPTWMIEINLDEHHPAGRNPNFAAVFEMFWSAGYRALLNELGRVNN